MQILNSQDSDFNRSLEKLVAKPLKQDQKINDTVANIIRRVISEKNEAIINFTKQFDDVVLKPQEMVLSNKEILEGCNQVSDEQKKAVEFASDRIKDFHKKQKIGRASCRERV